MAEPVSFEKHEVSQEAAVGLIVLDSPPVNALGFAVREAIARYLQAAIEDASIGAVVLIGRGRCFSGGADIREFGKPSQSPNLREVIDLLEQAPKPMIAAIHGTAIGGGLELSLGCHYRVGDASARLGLPEIKLGLLPGAGGTQRLPRLIGVEPALETILSGEFMPADRARELGLLDAVIEGELQSGALAFAAGVIAEDRPLRRLCDLDCPPPPAELFEKTRDRLAKRARGLIAPFLCLECVENAVKLPFAEGMAREREAFIECLNSEQSKGQRHIFFAERQAAKIPDVPADTPVQVIERAAVVGCGTMGGGIAMNFANAGIPVTVMEGSRKALDKGLSTIGANYAGSVSRGRISQAQMDQRIDLIKGTTKPADLAEADIVIEAVFEEMDLKKQVFALLDRTCKPEAILASNTSTLDINEIAASTGRPDKVIGTHFFSPANVMRLMENVRGKATSKETIATVMALSKRIGKVGVLVGVCDGFVGNRMLHPYLREANFLLEEGALPQQVDKVIQDFGLPMGPFAMADLAGLDVGWRIRKRQAETRPAQERYSPIADRICELGRFGQKTGAGWYRYESGSRHPQPDPEIEALIKSRSEELGIQRREISDQEIFERCLYPLINEGARILAEGIALRASDIDVVWVYGYAFPAHRGGPMFYADQVGLGRIHETLARLYEKHGDAALEPAPLLAELATGGKRFADL